MKAIFLWGVLGICVNGLWSGDGRECLRETIRPGVPAPFMEVMEQYKAFADADVRDINADEVREKFAREGEWCYVFNELAGWINGHDEVTVYYSLADLTGDGFPELLMGTGWYEENDPSLYIIYYYDVQAELIRQESASSYFVMSVYADGIVEYASGGAVCYTMTYWQFQEGIGEWGPVERLAVHGCFVNEAENGFYREYEQEGVTVRERISKEEYYATIAQYTAEPLELDWESLTAFLRLPGV